MANLLGRKALFLQEQLELGKVDVYFDPQQAVCPASLHRFEIARLMLHKETKGLSITWMNLRACAVALDGDAAIRAPWSSICLISAGDLHLIDWATVPESMLDGYNRETLRDLYGARNHTAQWYGDFLSIGSAALLPEEAPPTALAAPWRNSKLPAGWRVISGGAR